MPASQIARKRLIDKSIKLLNRPRPQMNLPKRTPATPNQTPQNQPPQVPREVDDRQENVPPPAPDDGPQNVRPPPIRHFEPNPLMEFHKKTLALRKSVRGPPPQWTIQ